MKCFVWRVGLQGGGCLVFYKETLKEASASQFRKGLRKYDHCFILLVS